MISALLLRESHVEPSGVSNRNGDILRLAARAGRFLVMTTVPAAGFKLISFMLNGNLQTPGVFDMFAADRLSQHIHTVRFFGSYAFFIFDRITGGLRLLSAYGTNTLSLTVPRLIAEILHLHLTLRIRTVRRSVRLRFFRICRRVVVPQKRHIAVVGVIESMLDDDRHDRRIALAAAAAAGRD